jgi:hypothetical protein
MKCEITKSNYLTFFVVQTFGIYFVNHFGMCNVFYGIHHTYNVTLLTLCNQGLAHCGHRPLALLLSQPVVAILSLHFFGLIVIHR